MPTTISSLESLYNSVWELVKAAAVYCIYIASILFTKIHNHVYWKSRMNEMLVRSIISLNRVK